MEGDLDMDDHKIINLSTDTNDNSSAENVDYVNIYKIADRIADR